MFLKKLELKIDRLLIRVYKHVDFKLLEKYLVKKTKKYSKEIIKFAREILSTSKNEEEKMKVIEYLKELQSVISN